MADGDCQKEAFGDDGLTKTISGDDNYEHTPHWGMF